MNAAHSLVDRLRQSRDRLRVHGEQAFYESVIERFQRINNPPRLLPRELIECERAGLLHFHMHIALGDALGVGKPRDYCVVFRNAAQVKALADDVATLRKGDATYRVARNRRNDMKRAVLIDVPEVLKPQKRPVLPLIPKRLYPADRCPHLGMDAAQLISARIRREPAVGTTTVLVPLLLATAHGEGSPIQGMTGMGDGQLIDGVIESGAQVIDDIPNPGAEMSRDFLAHDEAEIVSGSVRLEFGNDYCGITLLEPLNSRLESYKVMVSASQFQYGRPLRQRVSQGLNSTNGEEKTNAKQADSKDGDRS